MGNEKEIMDTKNGTNRQDIIVYGFVRDPEEDGTPEIVAALNAIRDITTLLTGAPATIREAREAVSDMVNKAYPIGFLGVPDNALPIVKRTIAHANLSTVKPPQTVPTWFG